MRAALVGNYGVGNLGDEALRDYFLSAFPDVEWKVVSAAPKAGDYARLPGGIRSFLGFRWVRTLRMMREADAVVFGGGSLFTDVESPFACFLWWIHAMAAWLLDTKVVLAFQGMGPYETKRGEWFARSVFRKAAYISVRDEESFKRVEQWEKSTKVIQTFDPVFSQMLNKKVHSDAKNLFVIIPRKNSSAMFLEKVYEALKSSEWEEVRIVLMEGESEEEQKIASDIMSNVLHVTFSIQATRSLDELMNVLSGSKMVYAQRFHGALAALAAGVPFQVFPQGEGDKLSVAAALATEGPGASARLLESVRTGEQTLRAWFSHWKNG